MKSLDVIEAQILESSNPNDRLVRGLWSVDCFYNPPNNGRVFDYKFLVSQTLAQGCAYSENTDYSRDYLREHVGRDFAELNITDTALKVSLLDSIYPALFPPNKTETFISDANSFDKLKWRTEIIYNAAQKLLGASREKTIANIGVVGDIIQRFKAEGYDVLGLDFDPSIVGTNFNDAPIIDGGKTLDVLPDVDLAIVTGMTITTETIDDILKCCTANNIKVIVFAETGAGFADYYTKNGADVYLSEFFPFYIFNGQSRIDVCYS